MEIIEITPDSNGKAFITLFGTKYEIRIKKAPKQTKDKQTKEEK